MPNSTLKETSPKLEKEVGAICPNCGFSGLNIYYDDGADTPLGARCDNCGFNGFFLKDELIPLHIIER